MQFLTVLFLASLTIVAISLQRTYGQVPAKELKRRAREGDDSAVMLYRVVAYGHSLRAILWLVIGLSAGGFFVYISHILPYWPALFVSGLFVWFGFVWLYAGEATVFGRTVASKVASPLSKILVYAHTPIDWVYGMIRRLRRLPVHTRLYEKADLLDLLDQQQAQADNRVEQTELEIMRSTLLFGDKLIRDVMTPRRVVTMVSVEDDLGPIVMDELHASGHSRFPVYEGNEDNIIGTLFLRDLLNRRSGGKVKSVMKKHALYLHEEQSLYDALQAILKTHHHLFVVVNSFEEYTGVITIEDVLEQIVGKSIVDEFDQYEDMRAVATIIARKKHVEHVESNSAVSEGPASAQTEPLVEGLERPSQNPKKEPEVDEVIEV